MRLTDLFNLFVLLAIVMTVLFVILRYSFLKLEKNLKLSNRTLHYDCFTSAIIGVVFTISVVVLHLVIRFYFNLDPIILKGLTLLILIVGGIVLFLKVIVPIEENSNVIDENNFKNIVKYNQSKLNYFLLGIPIVLIIFIIFGFVFLAGDSFEYLFILIVCGGFLIVEIVNRLLTPTIIISDNFLKYNDSFFVDFQVLLEDITDIKVRQMFLKKECVDIFCNLKDSDLEKKDREYKMVIRPLENMGDFIETLRERIEDDKIND